MIASPGSTRLLVRSNRHGGTPGRATSRRPHQSRVLKTATARTIVDTVRNGQQDMPAMDQNPDDVIAPVR